MNNHTFDIVCVAVICLAVVGAALYIFSGDDAGDDGDGLGLTSTKLSMTPGEEYSLGTWDIPSGKVYDDISWESDDPFVVSVEDGTLTAHAIGTAKVTASVKKDGDTYHDTCTVTVGNTAEERTLSYDAFSENMDFAELSGDGFEKGLLSLTFNIDGNIVIALCGYDREWLVNDKDSIGCMSDFSKVVMTVTDADGYVEATTTHTKNSTISHETGGMPSGTVGASCNKDAASTLIAVHGLTYGEYDVAFEIYSLAGKVVDLVEGHFSYQQGDGLRDASGTFSRCYAWRFDANDDGKIDDGTELFSFTLEYDYADYWNSYAQETKLIRSISGSELNRTDYSDVATFCRISPAIEELASELKKVYTGSSYDDLMFAQFVLAFGQINYEYETDDIQYYRLGGGYYETTDIWAFADETLFSRNGDCEDTSILIATLYKCLGYEAGAIVLPSHMALAVSVDGYTDHGCSGGSSFVAKATYDNETYYMCESTVDAPVKCAKTSLVYPQTTTLSNLAVYKDLPTSGGFGVQYSYNYYLVGLMNVTFEGDEFTFYEI